MAKNRLSVRVEGCELVQEREGRRWKYLHVSLANGRSSSI